ncbi:MAG: ribonuclease E inhibitor RraB [Micrococcales bacterium]
MRDFGPANRLLIEQRILAGDQPDLTHRVQHFCYFSNQNMAMAAESAFRSAGYDTLVLTRTLKSQILVMHYQRIGVDAMNLVCQEVSSLADQFDGEYGGWDSPIMSSELASSES